MKKQSAFWGLLLSFTVWHATVINVPGDYPTIQGGINASVNDDIVLVQPGIYFGDIDFTGKEITLCSLFYTTQDTSYISETILDGNNSGSVVKFENGENSNSILSGFTITNGNAYSGGGIYCTNSEPVLENLRIINNVACIGGGIYCYDNSGPNMTNLTIAGNFAEDMGGGIYCFDNSDLHLNNVRIIDNSAEMGGGIFCIDYSNLLLINVVIRNNSAYGGGGIYCYDHSGPNLNGVTITDNSAIFGGGILCNWYSSPNFSSSNRCNIFLNGVNNRGVGCDIYTDSNINVIVDTFTVMNPTDFHTSPLENFTFDILNGIQTQFNADLFVSSEGDNNNSGLTVDEPLRTIQYACSIILADSLDPHTIYLAEGIYSPAVNGEYLPVSIPEFVTLEGNNEAEVIIDGEYSNGVFRFENVENVKISDLTIINGYLSHGGGIHCYYSNPVIENVTITGNIATSQGGGIYCTNSNPVLTNITITDNNASLGGGIYCFHSDPVFTNVTIAGNLAHLSVKCS
ncbi:MAG: DUF1565 domain-containing protein [Candidatus Cloacimonetes bacterium]|nr:DUF1565 domain-containing protein [Candidatus Cloacimonadota bacterium]